MQFSDLVSKCMFVLRFGWSNLQIRVWVTWPGKVGIGFTVLWLLEFIAPDQPASSSYPDISKDEASAWGKTQVGTLVIPFFKVFSFIFQSSLSPILIFLCRSLHNYLPEHYPIGGLSILCEHVNNPKSQNLT